jgi:hypothetical protein
MSDLDPDSGRYRVPRVERAAVPRRSPLGTVLVAGLVALAVSAVVTVGLQFVLVPSGVGWRRLVHEGTVTVPGGKPFTVHYPSSFARPPSLSLEPVGNDQWFYSIDEQTADHFTVTNTTVRRDSGTPVMLTLRWRAEGARW